VGGKVVADQADSLGVRVDLLGEVARLFGELAVAPPLGHGRRAPARQGLEEHMLTCAMPRLSSGFSGGRTHRPGMYRIVLIKPGNAKQASAATAY